MALLAALLAVPTVAFAGDDTPIYEKNTRSFYGQVSLPNESTLSFEVAADQIRLRNGDSHKVWVVPEGTTGIARVDGGVTSGVTVACPALDAPGPDAFTDGDMPIQCTYEFDDEGPSGDLLLQKSGRPSAEAVAAADPEVPTIILDGTSFAGSFTNPKTESPASVAVVADVIRFADGAIEYYIPESHKKVVEGFSGSGFQVRCPFDGPGVEAFEGSVGQFDCSWKAGYGSSAPRGTVTLFAGAVIGQPEDATFTVGAGVPGGIPSDLRGECGDGTNQECDPLTGVYSSSDDPSNPFVRFVKISPTTGYVFLERFTLTYDPLETEGTTRLLYDDIGEVDDKQPVPVCNLTYGEVNVGSKNGTSGVADDDLDIADAYDSPGAEAGLVLPGDDTTCYLIQEHSSAGGGLVEITYVLYSEDGWRGAR